MDDGSPFGPDQPDFDPRDTYRDPRLKAVQQGYNPSWLPPSIPGSPPVGQISRWRGSVSNPGTRTPDPLEPVYGAVEPVLTGSWGYGVGQNAAELGFNAAQGKPGPAAVNIGALAASGILPRRNMGLLLQPHERARLDALPGEKVPGYAEKIVEARSNRWPVVYHGTPHEWTPEEGAPLGQFNPQHVGSGEGNATFSHAPYGYHAEAEPTAIDYRNKLAGADLEGSTGNVNLDVLLRKAYGGDWQALKESGSVDPKIIADIEARGAVPKATPSGKIYQSILRAPKEEFMRWELPMVKQSPQVRAALMDFATERATTINAERERILDRGTDAFGKPLRAERMYELSRQLHPETMTPQQLYQMMQVQLGATSPGQLRARATQALADKGIPGVRYFDRLSRDGLGEGTSNFAVWHPIVDPIRKYALPAAGTIPLAGTVLQQSDDADNPFSSH
jgi:hypothetical protein